MALITHETDSYRQKEGYWGKVALESIAKSRTGLQLTYVCLPVRAITIDNDDGFERSLHCCYSPNHQRTKGSLQAILHDNNET